MSAQISRTRTGNRSARIRQRSASKKGQVTPLDFGCVTIRPSCPAISGFEVAPRYRPENLCEGTALRFPQGAGKAPRGAIQSFRGVPLSPCPSIFPTWQGRSVQIASPDGMKRSSGSAPRLPISMTLLMEDIAVTLSFLDCQYRRGEKPEPWRSRLQPLPQPTDLVETLRMTSCKKLRLSIMAKDSGLGALVVTTLHEAGCRLVHGAFLWLPDLMTAIVELGRGRRQERDRGAMVQHGHWRYAEHLHVSIARYGLDLLKSLLRASAAPFGRG